MGNYVYGRQDKKWIEGDLSGIRYLEDACFKQEEAKKMLEFSKKEIRVTETYFINGDQFLQIRHERVIGTPQTIREYEYRNALYQRMDF